MGTMHAGFKRADDHFHPTEAEDDPMAQRRLRGQLEQIDYTAWACNREVGKTLGQARRDQITALALAAAHARTAWVAEGLKVADPRQAADEAAIARLCKLRTAYEELREVYEGARRMVERGYLAYEGPAG